MDFGNAKTFGLELLPGSLTISAVGMILPDPDEAWARVELYRWQTGHLPDIEQHEPLNIPLGLRNMAKVIDVGERANFPSPFNVAIVLRYVAGLLEKPTASTNVHESPS